MIPDVIRIFIPAVTSFWLGIALAPVVSHYLYKYRVWKRVDKEQKTALDGSAATEFNKIRETKDARTPRMGGIVIWLSALLTAGFFYLLSHISSSESAELLDFVSRSQTWIPLMTLALGALVGFINDVLDVIDPRGEKGIPVSVRLALVTLLSLFVGWWFYSKLGIESIGIPFYGPLYIGAFVVPLFILSSLCMYASGVIDGIDGLSGGVFASIFSAYACIAFANGQDDLAALSATLVGSLLAFLWFNIPPARFWMTETGSMAVTLAIPAIAFLTDLKGEGNGVFVLPIVAGLLFATVLSNVIQVFSKKFFGRKFFRIAPLHHHFEAIGWPSYKVTMRYWILSIIFAITGVVIALVG